MLPDLLGTGYELEDLATLGDLVEEPLDLSRTDTGHKPQMLSHTIFFDDETQQTAWQQFVSWLRDNGTGPTDSAKIINFVTEAISDET